MTANKIIKSFIVISVVLAVIILFLIIASYLSYEFNKQRDILNQRETSEQDSLEFTKSKEYSETELLQILNPGKTDEEIIEIKEINDSLPYKPYNDEELED